MNKKIFRLDEAVVKTLFGKNIIGMYVLGDYTEGHFKVGYVGRSDKSLRNRLLQHSKTNEYNYFYYTPTDTIFEAFKLECREWHRFFDITNSIHPDSPNNLPYKCPYCNAAKEIHHELIKRGV